jgi:hypothetical protein
MNNETGIKKERGNACAKCNAHNGGVKRWKVYFSYNRSAYLCAACIEFLGGNPASVEWLEQHAVYDKQTGKLVGFEKEAVL